MLPKVIVGVAHEVKAQHPIAVPGSWNQSDTSPRPGFNMFQHVS